MLAISMGRKTQINLVGGLGNQLFGYMAGKYLEEICGHRVVFNTWHISRGLTDHGVSLEGRGLPGKFISKPPLPRWARLAKKPFRSEELGWDPNLQMVKRGREVNGYFQSWKYLKALEKVVPSQHEILLRRSQSSWLSDLLELIHNQKPVIVHFRRGDYKKVPEAMGLLGKDYYRKALSALPEGLQSSPIWIFSDEPKIAREFFADFPNEFTFIDPPQDNDPGESLFLMSQGQSHVISNSTFAWWGAVLSETSDFVMAPSPWLRGYETPRDFFPEGWILLEHEWASE